MSDPATPGTENGIPSDDHIVAASDAPEPDELGPPTKSDDELSDADDAEPGEDEPRHYTDLFAYYSAHYPEGATSDVRIVAASESIEHSGKIGDKEVRQARDRLRWTKLGERMGYLRGLFGLPEDPVVLTRDQAEQLMCKEFQLPGIKENDSAHGTVLRALQGQSIGWEAFQAMLETMRFDSLRALGVRATRATELAAASGPAVSVGDAPLDTETAAMPSVTARGVISASRHVGTSTSTPPPFWRRVIVPGRSEQKPEAAKAKPDERRLLSPAARGLLATIPLLWLVMFVVWKMTLNQNDVVAQSAQDSSFARADSFAAASKMNKLEVSVEELNKKVDEKLKEKDQKNAELAEEVETYEDVVKDKEAYSKGAKDLFAKADTEYQEALKIRKNASRSRAQLEADALEEEARKVAAGARMLAEAASITEHVRSGSCGSTAASTVLVNGERRGSDWSCGGAGGTPLVIRCAGTSIEPSSDEFVSNCGVKVD